MLSFWTLGCYHFSWCPCYHFWSPGCFHFGSPGCYHFSWCTGCNLFMKVSKVSCLGCYHLCYHLMLSFFTVSKFFHFYVIIFPYTYFVLSFMLSFLGCYHLCYHLMLSFFTVSKCYLFLCYHFPLYIFSVIIYVIIWCYHLLLSFPPFFLFPENVTHSHLDLLLSSGTKCYHLG
jgi:hypothetical protein